jgi:hypothetical protein
LLLHGTDNFCEIIDGAFSIEIIKRRVSLGLINDEVEGIWKGVAMILSRYYPSILLERLMETTKNFHQDGWCPIRDSNRAVAEYKTKAPNHSVEMMCLAVT